MQAAGERRHMEYPKIYAVDFDGTLAIGAKWPQIGEANEELFQFLIKRREAGDKVILWTCREGEMLEAAVKFCNSHGLCFDAINDNVKENKEKFQNNSRKVFANYYIDDKNRTLEEAVKKRREKARKDDINN